MVNTAANGWKLKTLDELGFVGRGKSKHRPRDAEHLYGGPYPFIQTGDVRHSNLYVNKYNQTYSEVGLAQSKLWKSGTLCITIAANIADTAILGIDACFPDSVIGFVPDEEKADVKFVKYLFNTLQSRYQQYSQGAAQDNLSQKKLLSLKFLVPKVSIQEKIANILSSYDHLIENNLRRIDLLEQSARLLYEEWFVRLRFPGYERARMSDGIPQGWAKKKIRDVGKVVTGKTPSTKSSENYGGAIPFVKTPDMHSNIFVIATENQLTETGAKTQHKKFIPKGSLMVSCIGTIGVVSIAAEQCQTNQQINSVVVHETGYHPFYYFAFKHLKERMEALGGGATMTNINKSKFENLDILTPLNQILDLFSDYCLPIFDQILNLQFQNQKLKQARDLLLPKLMDGEIAV